MILRRIVSSIRNQDWVVVAIEIMIVVVGIFIGLKVDDWNKAHKEDLRAKAVLVDLRMDFLAIDEVAAEQHLRLVQGRYVNARVAMSKIDQIRQLIEESVTEDSS